MKALAAVAALALLAAGCGGTAGPPSTAGRPPAAATPASPPPSLTPLQQCVSVVTKLLEQSQAAVREGYPEGISTTAVMEKYGVRSAIWQAFWTLDTQELDDFAQNGVGTGDPAEVLQVPRTCEDYLPSGSGGQG